MSLSKEDFFLNFNYDYFQYRPINEVQIKFETCATSFTSKPDKKSAQIQSKIFGINAGNINNGNIFCFLYNAFTRRHYFQFLKLQ